MVLWRKVPFLKKQNFPWENFSFAERFFFFAFWMWHWQTFWGDCPGWMLWLLLPLPFFLPQTPCALRSERLSTQLFGSRAVDEAECLVSLAAWLEGSCQFHFLRKSIPGRQPKKSCFNSPNIFLEIRSREPFCLFAISPQFGMIFFLPVMWRFSQEGITIFWPVHVCSLSRRESHRIGP